MKFLRIFFLLLVVGLFFTARQASSQSTPERKIVVFKSGVSQPERLSLLSRHQAALGKELRLINAMAVRISSLAAEKLARDPKILRIDPDVEVYALDFRNLKVRKPMPTATPTPTFGTQPIPWGIARINADDAWNISSGSGVKVAVIDTGIDRDHPDLDANLAGCLNFIQSWKTCEDDNGHGTHVSGIIAAENNNIGVVGVAPQAKIYALKVLNRQGSGYLSDIIEALDWAVANQMQVVNMSLGTSSDVLSFHEAVKRVNAAGIIQVAAAGNSGPTADSVIYPARYSEVIAVSATDSNNQVPSWSSRGPEVDLAAPGVNSNATYLKGGYKILSGTSMAAPHVTGVVALRLEDHPGETLTAIENILESNTDSLPFDPTLVGAGLVDAYKVVTAP